MTIPLDSLTPEQTARFKALTSAPRLSWPTVAMWLVVTVVYVSSYVFAFRGDIPLWVGTVVNSLIGYFAFSVTHDSIHRSISTNTALNDFIGQCTVLLGSPYVNLKLFRWGHILHHRFASSPKDPDWVLHGAGWTLPLRWMLIDVFYLLHAVRHGDKVSRDYLRTSLVLTALCAAGFSLLVLLGYGWHLLMLWFIPSRMILLTLGFSFFWLPHVPHEVSQSQNFTRATTVRMGHEWLLGPALQYQHYHLIHHLFPSTPFYNNYKVWQIVEPILRQRDLAVQHDFAIKPTVYPAGSRA